VLELALFFPLFFVFSPQVALLPLDSPSGGCAEFVVVDAVYVVTRPSVLSHDVAAAALGYVFDVVITFIVHNVYVLSSLVSFPTKSS
jgi:hypothetical protein